MIDYGKLIHKKSYVTDTRLMGVVAIKSFFKDENGNDVAVFIHIDYETYGIDGVEISVDFTEREIEYISNKVYGGLGGELVKIELEEAGFLISEGLKLGKENISKDKMKVLDLYKFDKIDEKKLYSKIIKKLNSEYEVINYYVMRLIANDFSLMRWLSTSDFNGNYKFDTTLLKNSIKSIGNDEYVSKALVVSNDRHSNKRYLFKMNSMNIEKVEFLDSMDISNYEAAFQLNKAEFIVVYTFEQNKSVLVNLVEERLKNVMINEHEAGDLMTYFKKDNSHVNSNEYCINGDVFSYLFFTDENQFIVTSYEEEKFEDTIKILADIMVSHNMELVGEFKFDKQVLIDFINSTMGDFIEFMVEELQ